MIVHFMDGKLAVTMSNKHCIWTSYDYECMNDKLSKITW